MSENTTYYPSEMETELYELKECLSVPSVERIIGDNGIYFVGPVKLVVQVQGSGEGTEVNNGTANYYDYDGTLLFSGNYVSPPPQVPFHNSLMESCGWNGALENESHYSGENRVFNIGQMYQSADGDTMITIRLKDGYLEPYLRFTLFGKARVNWGDGTAQSVNSTIDNANNYNQLIFNQRHLYPSSGEYAIRIAVIDGKIQFGGGNFLDLNRGSHIVWNNADTVQENACYQESVESIVIGSNAAAYNYACFSDCTNLKTVILPESILDVSELSKSIRSMQFRNCKSLQSVVLPIGIESIDEQAFASCERMTSIMFPDTVTSIGSGAFRGCRKLSLVTVPPLVKRILADTFNDCRSLEIVALPDGLRSIGERVFDGCIRLEQVSIPDSVETIGSSTFSGCSSLKNVKLPSEIVEIPNELFMDCINLKSIVIPESVQSIGEKAFSGCSSLKTIALPDSVLEIGTRAFYYCSNLTSVSLSDAIAVVSASAFAYCSDLESVDFSSALESISDGAFQYCNSLEHIVLPDGVTQIGNNAFLGCSRLLNIRIPDGLLSIGSGAFQYCSFTEFTIPSSVTTIGDNAFYACNYLNKIVFTSSTPPILTASSSQQSIGLGLNTSCIIYVPRASLSSYTTAANYPDPSIYTYVGYGDEDGVDAAMDNGTLVLSGADVSVDNSILMMNSESIEMSGDILDIDSASAS